MYVFFSTERPTADHGSKGHEVKVKVKITIRFKIEVTVMVMRPTFYGFFTIERQRTNYCSLGQGQGQIQD